MDDGVAPEPDQADQAWRDPRVKPLPDYRVGSSFFTVSVHHSGEWSISDIGRREYNGGLVYCFDYCDWDYFSTLDLDRLMALMGNPIHAGYWWVPHLTSFHDGSELRSDADCLRMFDNLVTWGNRECHVYLITALRALGPAEMPFPLLHANPVIHDNEDDEDDSEEDPDYVVSNEDEVDREESGSEVNNDSGSKSSEESDRSSGTVQGNADNESSESDPEYTVEAGSENESDGWYGWAEEHALAHDLMRAEESEARAQALEAQAQLVQVDIEEPEYGLDEDEINGFNPIPPTWWNHQDNVAHEAGAARNESDAEIEMNESDLESVQEDSDGEPRVSRSTRTFTPGRPWSEFKFILGLEFASVEQLREAVREHFIHINRSFKFLENNRVKLRARCSSPRCPWILYARVQRRDNTTFRVNTLQPKHNCGIVFNSKLVNAEWLAKHFLDQFRMNVNMQFQHFHQLVANTKFSHYSRWMFYAVKKRALELLEGSETEQYAKLEDYCLQLRQVMPGSTAIVKSDLVDGQRVFQRVYICLQACKTGFRHCRKVIGLDGCFLKGKSRGILLAKSASEATTSKAGTSQATTSQATPPPPPGQATPPPSRCVTPPPPPPSQATPPRCVTPPPPSSEWAME